MSGVLLAIPSKGRLEEASRAALSKVGLNIDRPGGARSYIGTIDVLPEISVRFLSASEIAGELVHGRIDFGITGEDLLHEAMPGGMDQVVVAVPLGFGHADVVVALPDCWIDVTSMRDLADVASDYRHRHGRWLRVATKYVNLTRGCFSGHGIAQYRIVESLGATEAAPASGAAELIVDITSSGSTLKANALRVPEHGVILRSQANLVVAKAAGWPAGKRKVLARFLAYFGDAVASRTIGVL